jgi:selenoprotein W-related protein
VTDDILSNYQHVIENFRLIMGSKGAFEFKVDGELLYSKKQLGRHAEPGEVLRLFQQYIGPNVATYPQSK